MRKGLATRGWRGFVGVLAFLTAFWVVCPYVCAAAGADQGIHACCTEEADVRVSASTPCCGSMGQLYLPTAGQEPVPAPLASLTISPVSYRLFPLVHFLTVVDCLDPPRTLVSGKIALLL